jgi:hypothetical protein
MNFPIRPFRQFQVREMEGQSHRFNQFRVAQVYWRTRSTAWCARLADGVATDSTNQRMALD